MGKASKAKRDGSSRQQRIAAQRAAARRAEIRNRILIAAGSVVVIIAVVLAFVLVKVNSNGSSKSSASASGPTGTALASVVKDTTTVPASTLDTVAGGTVSAFPKSISGGPGPTSNGKPGRLYMGARDCPFCPAGRGGMVVALSRFGTFKNLGTTRSSSSDEFPNTATWTFYKSSYTSKYLTFSSVEMETNKLASGGQSYTTLQTPTKAQSALLSKYDAPPYVSSADAGSIPFVDFGNKYLIGGASYRPQVLQGKTWSQIATALKTPSSAIAKAVDGSANYITAAICQLTGNQPATACTPAVKALEQKLCWPAPSPVPGPAPPRPGARRTPRPRAARRMAPPRAARPRTARPRTAQPRRPPPLHRSRRPGPRPRPGPRGPPPPPARPARPAPAGPIRPGTGRSRRPAPPAAAPTRSRRWSATNTRPRGCAGRPSCSRWPDWASRST